LYTGPYEFTSARRRPAVSPVDNAGDSLQSNRARRSMSTGRGLKDAIVRPPRPSHAGPAWSSLPLGSQSRPNPSARTHRAWPT